MTLEMGKALAESRAEIAYAAEFFRWFSEEAVRIHGRYMVNTTGKGRILTMRQPVGPCVFVTPWNFPTAMGTRKIAPAIAAGCTIVVKPAQQTPLSMLALAQILQQAGLPGGVLNVITSRHSGAVIEPLLRDPRTRKLSFTGSTEVGRKLIEQSAEQVLRVSMELGGNAPFLVFDDADLDAAVDGRCSPRCATSVRPVPPPTGSTCMSRSPKSSRCGSPSACAHLRSVAAPIPGSTSGRSSMKPSGRRSRSSSVTRSSAAPATARR